MTVFATGLLVLTLIVDQVEGDVAAVETEDLSIHWLPLDLLPKGTREGDHIEVRLQRVPRRREETSRQTARRTERPATTTTGRETPTGESR